MRWWVMTSGATRLAMLQSNRQQQQTSFYGPILSPNQLKLFVDECQAKKMYSSESQCFTAFDNVDSASDTGSHSEPRSLRHAQVLQHQQLLLLWRLRLLLFLLLVLPPPPHHHYYNYHYYYYGSFIRSTQPSTLRDTVNKYQLSDWIIIINGDGGCRR